MDNQDPFAALAPQRPRLMATAAALARVKAVIASSPAVAKIRDAVLKQASEVEYAPYVEPNFKSWIRLHLDHLSASRLALSRIQTLGMAWFLTHDARFARRAKRELATICAFDVWQAPDHFLDAAEMTHAAGIGYDWFYDELTAAERHAIAQAILDKGLKPGVAQLTSAPEPDWPTRVTNWNLVCNGGLMVGALAIAEPDPSREIDPAATRQVFDLCRRSVATGFNGYAPDGSWAEGPGYWTYATEYAAYLLSAMTTALGTEFGFADSPGLAATGTYRLHAEGPPVGTSSLAGLLFNYADSPETHSGSWCLRWLAQRYNRPVYNWVANHRKKVEAMDLLWFSPDEPPPGPGGISPTTTFQGVAELAILRGDWDATDALWQPWSAPAATPDLGVTYVGIRAGRNTPENHHGHLDLGSFVLDCNGVRWASDIPPVADAKPPYKADYELPGYFDLKSARRFTYYRTGTIGHNTLVVNGANQTAEAEARIVAFATTPSLVIAVVDLSAAYPDCVSARRGFALIERQHVLIVDEITTRTALPVTWQMHTRAAVGLDGRSAYLVPADGADPAKELFLELLEPAAGVFGLGCTEVPLPQAPNAGVRKLVVNVSDASSPTRIAVYLSAKRDPFATLPAPLTGPLADWIAWTNAQPAS